MPLQATSGAASYDAFGGGVPVEPVYIEQIFSTYLYTGNGSTQTITNGIDLAGKGGLVWTKVRNQTYDHVLVDTARGANKELYSNTTGAQFDASSAGSVSSFSSTGYSLDYLGGSFRVNKSPETYASWTFRKQPKFFDVVTYTGTGGSLTVNHNLGSTPGCIIVKRINSTSDWFVHHQDVNYDGSYLKLNSTAANNSGSVPPYFLISVTDTYFTMQATGVANVSGATYVAYLFAHNAGGFGLTGTDNVISCGSYTGNGSATGPVVTLGYEPQWVMVKRATGGLGNWTIVDNMRGMSQTSSTLLYPNNTSADSVESPAWIAPNATGFQLTTSDSGVNGNTNTFIYIAIRRGPMKVPTDATKVFKPVVYSGTNANQNVTAGFPVSLHIQSLRSGSGHYTWDRLRGNTQGLETQATSAETNYGASAPKMDSNTGIQIQGGAFNAPGENWIEWFFQRAPSFFDEVCYSGNSTAGRTLTHNLGVTPQLIIVKARTIVVGWAVYAESAGNTKYSELNDVTRFTTGINCWNDTSPTASVFSLSSNARVNRTGDTYVAYLFATCAGVSKVGSYTGTGSLQTINCGFTSGARFVLIKNQDVNGSWYVWDSARGISSSNDPYLLLNSTAAEVTNTNYVDTDSTGFKVTGNTAVNTFGDTYIFLAIA